MKAIKRRAIGPLPLLLMISLLAAPAAWATQDIARLEQALHEAVNEVRRSEGLAPLQLQADLSRLARDYSRRMQEEDFFDHTDPQGRDAADRLLAAGFDYRHAGENIAYNYNIPDPIETALQSWLDSPGHRANILNPKFTQTGIGIWRAGAHFYFTQLFFTPLRQ